MLQQQLPGRLLVIYSTHKMRNYFKSGSWNITCDRCSKKTKADEIKKEWTGFLVCPVCFEYRHPQDFVRARQDKISVPFTRPRPVDVFVIVDYGMYVDSGYVADGYFEGLMI